MKRVTKGFTLIELLVVIAIIGLLSTLAVVALNSARQRSRDAKRVADIRQIQTALELGYSETSQYPSGTGVTLGNATNTTSVLCKDSTSGAPTWKGSTSGCSTVYMGLVPANPTPGGVGYYYVGTGTTAGYYILFTLEGNTGQLSTGGNCANPNGITSSPSC